MNRHSTLAALLLHRPESTDNRGSSTIEHLIDEILRRHVWVTGGACYLELTLRVLGPNNFKQLFMIRTCIWVWVSKSQGCAQGNKAPDAFWPLIPINFLLGFFLLQQFLLLPLPKFALEPLFFDSLEVICYLANRWIRYSFSLNISLNRCHPLKTSIFDNSCSNLLSFDLETWGPCTAFVRRCKSSLSP